MANNVPITAGTGTSIATDDVTGVHYQVFKLALGDEDAATRVADANPLPVKIAAAIVAGENHLGEIGGSTAIIRSNPTITAGAYSANDIVGGELTLTNAMRISGGTGVLHSVTVHDKAAQNAALEFYFFQSAPGAAIADNGAAAWTDTDEDLFLGMVPVAATDYTARWGDSFVTIRNIGLPVAASGSANLFLYIVTPGTPTYVSTTDLSFTFGFLRD